MRRFTLDERSVFNIQYPTRNFQQGSRCRIAALLQAIFPFLDLWIFLVGYWIFKEGLSNLVTTYNVTIDVRSQSRFGNLGKQREKMLQSAAPLGNAVKHFLRSSDLKGGTSQNEVMGVAQLVKSSIRATRSRLVTPVGPDVISPSHALPCGQGRATLVIAGPKCFTALPLGAGFDQVPKGRS